MAPGLTAVGATLVLAGAGGWGLLVARQLQRRPAELAALQAALEALRTEVEYARAPLPEALHRAALATPGPVDALFRGTAARLRERRGLGAPEAWARALAEAASRSAWSPADVAVLARFGAGLGGSSAADQVRLLSHCVARLRSAEAEAAAEAQRQARMWLYLGLCGGAALVIVSL